MIRKARRHHNIIEQYHGCTVTLKADKKGYVKYFAHSKYGKRRALKLAIEYRNKLEAKLKLAPITKRPTRSQRIFRANIDRRNNTGVPGVCYKEKFAYRTNILMSCYIVSWNDRWHLGTRAKPKHRLKVFTMGRKDKVTTDMLFHGLRTAIQFRREYEIAIREDTVFDHIKFLSWRSKRLYRKNAYIKFEVPNVN